MSLVRNQDLICASGYIGSSGVSVHGLPEIASPARRRGRFRRRRTGRVASKSSTAAARDGNRRRPGPDGGGMTRAGRARAGTGQAGGGVRIGSAGAWRTPASCNLGSRLSALGSRLWSALGSRLSALGSRLSALGSRLSALGSRPLGSYFKAVRGWGALARPDRRSVGGAEGCAPRRKSRPGASGARGPLRGSVRAPMAPGSEVRSISISLAFSPAPRRRHPVRAGAAKLPAILTHYCVKWV